jgi:hypothetical protein
VIYSAEGDRVSSIKEARANTTGGGGSRPVLPAGYVVSASRIADRQMILVGYRLADLLTRGCGEVGNKYTCRVHVRHASLEKLGRP